MLTKDSLSFCNVRLSVRFRFFFSVKNITFYMNCFICFFAFNFIGLGSAIYDHILMLLWLQAVATDDVFRKPAFTMADIIKKILLILPKLSWFSTQVMVIASVEVVAVNWMWPIAIAWTSETVVDAQQSGIFSFYCFDLQSKRVHQ